ncbi:MAG: hypothetical protein IT184_14540 [Acidobacteria bacterium]|nr:hypothetical protein [Acidobacteriota bacterium]
MTYRLAAGVLVAWLAVGCSTGPKAGPLVITGAGDSPTNNVVRVTGLSGAELRAVAAANLDEAATRALLTVSPSEAEAAPVAGRIVATETALDFQPRSPFDLNRHYVVRFDPSHLPTPRQSPAIRTIVRFSSATAEEPTFVTAVYPSAETWPENVRRFHVHFSGPMSRTSGLTFVHLQDEQGREIRDMLMAAAWNDAGTQLTIELAPERSAGTTNEQVEPRRLVRGRRYRIAIDQAWPDTRERPLAASFTRAFTAGPPATAPIDLRSWRITAPKAGTRTPVALVFPSPLDHALLLEAIVVRTADGRTPAGSTATGAAERAWTFTPTSPWNAGAYQLAVRTTLEDPAGNGIGRRATDSGVRPQPPTSATTEALSFDVR